MNLASTPATWKKASLIVFYVSLAFLLLTFVLPYVKLPQTASFSGPTSPYIGSNTTLSGFFIPPVNRGDPITITISNYSKDSISITVFPTAAGNIAPTGLLLLEGIPISTNFTAVVESTRTQPYGIYVVSYNHTTFVLKVSGSWSPFYVLTTYVLLGILFVIASAAALYYYTQADKRWTTENRALQGAPDN